MVISSIDLKDGHVVQLKNGKDLVLQRDDADALINDFNFYGDVAVIDLDAAMGHTDLKGNTVNTPLLKSLLRKGNVRTGGGVRSVKRARELISLGAEKVIVGSAAFNKEAKGQDDILNKEFLQELCDSIGKQRVIISVDSINGKIAVHGWKETLDIPLVAAAKAAEQYCSELLWTCVEKEGCMQGTNMQAAKELREAVKCKVVVAGGVSTVQEIAELERLGCDVQLGMALYTNKVSLKDSFIECLDWEKVGGLLPVIAQSVNGQVLMMGYSNREAFEKTFARAATFWKSKNCASTATATRFWPPSFRTEAFAIQEASLALERKPTRLQALSACTKQSASASPIPSPALTPPRLTTSASAKRSWKKPANCARRQTATRRFGKPPICFTLSAS